MVLLIAGYLQHVSASEKDEVYKSAVLLQSLVVCVSILICMSMHRFVVQKSKYSIIEKFAERGEHCIDNNNCGPAT